MKFEIKEQKENPLLKRKELLMELDYESGATPSKAALQQLIAEKTGASIELVEVSKIFSDTGRAKGKAWINIWETKPPEKKKKEKAETKTEEKKE